MINLTMDRKRKEKEKTESKRKRVNKCSEAASLSVPKMEGLAQRTNCVSVCVWVNNRTDGWGRRVMWEKAAADEEHFDVPDVCKCMCA